MKIVKIKKGMKRGKRFFEVFGILKRVFETGEREGKESRWYESAKEARG